MAEQPTPPEQEQNAPSGQEPQYSHAPFIRRAAWFALIVVIGLYLMWWVALYIMQEDLLYLNSELPELAKRQPYPGITELKRPLDAGGSVTAWLVTDPRAPQDQKRPLLVYAHGGGELIDYQQPTVMPYLALGFDVLLPEYRGFGRSGGEPSQEGITADVLHFIDEVTAREDIDAQRVVYHGKGVGGAILADVALDKPPSALILESTFASGARLMHDMYAPALLLKDPYRTDRALSRLVVPVIIYHGQTNDRYDFSHAEHLAEVAPRANLQAYPDDQPNFQGLMMMDEFWRRNTALLAQLDIIEPPSPPAESAEDGEDAPETQPAPIME